MVDLPQESSNPGPPDESPTGFAKVAEQLKRHTTDFLAVAILAMGLLAVGGKVSRWWGKSPEDAATSGQTFSQPLAWGGKGQGVSLEWGDLNYAIHRQEMECDADAASGQLEEIVLQQFAKVTRPKFPANAAETKLLAELKPIRPAREMEGEVELYRFDAGLPMILLTQPGEGDSRRVVCWARAFPQSPGRWLAILFYSANAAATQGSDFEPPPVPTGSRRIQSLGEAGRRWIGFRGSGPADEWQRHFDHWFADQNWQVIRPWSKTQLAWSAAFASPNAEHRADITFHQEPTGEWAGMIFIDRDKPIEAE